MSKAKENTPGAGESVQVISEALGRMLTVR